MEEQIDAGKVTASVQKVGTNYVVMITTDQCMVFHGVREVGDGFPEADVFNSITAKNAGQDCEFGGKTWHVAIGGPTVAHVAPAGKGKLNVTFEGKNG